MSEPELTGLTLVREQGRALRGGWRGGELFRYVYQPREPRIESVRPYFHPLRTLAGDPVTWYRPDDHPWHKGMAWSLCDVSGENFWGGPSYRRDQGYVQLPNNGAMVHRRFDLVEVRDGGLRFDERLTWITERGEIWIEELRRVGLVVLPEHDAWQLTFETTMSNVSGVTLRFGSPTTRGRDNAGYSGLFWRGPRSFTGGEVITPDGVGGDELMGCRAPWMAYTGRHDESGGHSSLLFRDDPANFSYPSRWFVRSGDYACMCPAPFFGEEYPLADGGDLTLRYDVLVVTGAVDHAACVSLAKQVSPISFGRDALGSGS